MLVLTRKIGDVIAIGDNIKIIVMSIKGKQVKIGIEADKSTIVHREEIYQKIKKENELASQSKTENIQQAGKLLNENNINSKPSKKIIIRKKNSV